MDEKQTLTNPCGSAEAMRCSAATCVRQQLNEGGFGEFGPANQPGLPQLRELRTTELILVETLRVRVRGTVTIEQLSLPCCDPFNKTFFHWRLKPRRTRRVANACAPAEYG
jgi:hypothetical protein